MTVPVQPAPNAVQTAIRRIAFGDSLDAELATEAFGTIMRGEATAAQIAALLVGLRVKGETAEEVTGAARAMRGAMVRLPVASSEGLVDTCGTGGGAVPTFNISTAAALLAAGAGVRIAKHGNRSFTTQCGSADVLEAARRHARCVGGDRDARPGGSGHHVHVRAGHAPGHATRRPRPP